MKIKSALISVFNKDGVDELARELDSNGVKIYSTGGTKKYLENLGIEVLAVEDFTNYPEVFGGRVKTLHPAIFGGILYRRDNESDVNELKEHNIPAIDLVVVDLYPFQDTVASGSSHSEIIEKIDIGGISLIRAAAKNYKFTSIISSRDQYEEFTEHYKLNNGEALLEYRSSLATSAFKQTVSYDTEIVKYFSGEKAYELRYGENPHQKASFVGNLDSLFTKLGGKELSYNNLLDVDAAVALVTDISVLEQCTFAILKHNNACGCAIMPSAKEAFESALAADPVSAFGGILICDKEIDLETAKEIDKLFYEVCIATSFSAEAKELLTARSKRVLLQWNRQDFKQDIVRSCLNGVLIQERDLSFSSRDQLSAVTMIKPTEDQIRDMLFAEKLVKHTKSNAIILVKDQQLIASGTGQTSRVDALNQAILKAKTFKLNIKGAAMASDAFFPFPDCVEIASEAGVATIVQPGGSIKDQLSIDMANSKSIVMVTTGVRHFRH